MEFCKKPELDAPRNEWDSRQHTDGGASSSSPTYWGQQNDPFAQQEYWLPETGATAYDQDYHQADQHGARGKTSKTPDDKTVEWGLILGESEFNWVLQNPDVGQLFPRQPQSNTTGTLTRETMESRVGVHLALRLLDYHLACESIEDEIRSAAAASGAFLSLFAGIAVGYFMPFLVQQLQAGFQTRALQEALSPTSDPGIVEWWRHTSTLVPAVENAATETGKMTMTKAVDDALGTDSAEAFLEVLLARHADVVNRVLDGLHTLTDEELLSTFMMYHELNTATYRQQIRTALAIFSRIQADTEHSSSVGSRGRLVGAQWITLDSGVRRLALIESNYFQGEDCAESRTTFVSWIPEEMHDIAIERTTGLEMVVQTLSPDDVEGLPDAEPRTVAGPAECDMPSITEVRRAPEH